MRLKSTHIPYISNKIVIDMANSSLVDIKFPIEELKQSIERILKEDLDKERALDERVYELLDEQEEEIEFMQVDRKNMFWLIKKKLAPEFSVILNNEDRHNNLAHLILQDFFENDFINFNVSENRIKNMIFASIEDYLKNYAKIEVEVEEKINNYKRKLVRGSSEYELVFEKLYAEELRKKGLL